MNISQKKILMGLILTVIGAIGFFKDIQTIFFLSFAALSYIIFFHKNKTITLGLVKLWCLSILIILFVTTGKNIFHNLTPVILSFSLYLSINLFGVYLISKSKSNNK